MKIADNDLLSDETRKASRNLLLISVPALFVYAFAINVDTLTILDIQIPREKLASVVFIIIIYDIYILLVNWLGDFTSWRTWTHKSEWSQFVGAKQPLADYLESEFSATNEKFSRAHAELDKIIDKTQGIVASLDGAEDSQNKGRLDRLLQIEKLLQEIRQAQTNNNLEELLRHSDQLTRALKRTATGIEHINIVSGILLIINNLLIPMICGITSIVLIIRTHFS